MTIKRLFFLVIFFIIIVVLIFSTFVVLGLTQEKLLLPQDYIMWIFKYPISRLALVFVLEFVFLYFLITFRELGQYLKEHKKSFLPTFAFANILLIYVLLFNVCVITNDKIINHSFFSPKGRVYNYTDIVSIDTGVYGKKKFNVPYTDKSGEFYYIITLKDGTKIDLNGDAGGTKNNQEMNEVFEEIDITLVNMDIKKTARTDNFELLEKDLDRIYSNKIKNILNNVK